MFHVSTIHPNVGCLTVNKKTTLCGFNVLPSFDQAAEQYTISGNRVCGTCLNISETTKQKETTNMQTKVQIHHRRNLIETPFIQSGKRGRPAIDHAEIARLAYSGPVKFVYGREVTANVQASHMAMRINDPFLTVERLDDNVSFVVRKFTKKELAAMEELGNA